MRLGRHVFHTVLFGILLAGCATSEDKVEVKAVAPSGPMAAESLNRSLREAAQKSEQAREYAAAATFYNTLYDRKPEDLEVAFGLARNLRRVGATARAVQVLETAIAGNPDDPNLVSELGKVHLASGDPEQALATLLRARELRPEDWRIHSALGITFDRLTRYDAARVSYEAALELSPDNGSVLNNYALSLVQTEQLDEGIKLLKRAANSRNSNIQIRQNLALLYALSGDLEEAEKLARRDLPERAVKENLAYYRRLASARRTTDSGSAIRSVSVGKAPRPFLIPLQIQPWDEDTEAERFATKSEPRQ